MTKILLVSHEASLSGAPRVAVEILRATRGVACERVVVIRWPGQLSDELTRAADRARLEPYRRTRATLRRFRWTRGLAVKVELAAARAILLQEKPDLVYLNTVLSACYVRPALALGIRVVLHSHEMDDAISWGLSRYSLSGTYPQVRLVACSEAAKLGLQKITGVDDVTVLPSLVDAIRVRGLASAQSPSPIRRPATGLVVACGSASRRKGPDLWLQVVRSVKEQMGSDCPDFVWIGDTGRGGHQRLAEELGVHDQVRFTGTSVNPYPTLALADLVTVPSRQDAFPLVVLEGMCLAKPVVAFDVGGIGEQLGDTGVLVPSADVDGMAAAVVALMRDPQRRKTLGERALQRSENVYNIERFREEVAALVATELARAV